MGNDNIPHLSKNDIEIKAEEVIEYFDKSILDAPQFTPLVSIVKKLKEEFNILFDFTSEIGTSSSGSKILGKFAFQPRAIYVDKDIVNDLRFPFVLAHEIGHMVLHRKVELPREEYDKFQDTEYDLISGKKFLLTSRDWIEWQANQFASAFIMPRSTFQNAIIEIQEGLGITKNLGFIYLENVEYSNRDFRKILDKLQEIYRVNKTNIEYRMNDLGVLIDKRSKNVKHISELLKEE